MLGHKRKTLYLVSLFFFIIIFSPLYAGLTSNWSDATIISLESTLHSYRQCIVIDSHQGIHVAWKDNSDIIGAGTDFDIFYKYKPFNEPWTTTELLTPLSVNSSTCLSLTIDTKDTLHLAFKDDTDMVDAGSDWDIFYQYKPWNKNWSEPFLISTESNGTGSCPNIRSDKHDTIHLVWADADLFNDHHSYLDIVYRKKHSGGQWMPIELISIESRDHSHDPAVAIDDSGSVHIVWYEKSASSNTYDIMYSVKEQNGTWSQAERISKECYRNSVMPQIDIDSKQQIHVIWNDNTNLFDNGYDYDIFYRKKSQNSWNDIEVISKKSVYDCKWPSIIIDGSDTIHVAWSDKTNYLQQDNDMDIINAYKEKENTWKIIGELSHESSYDSHWPRFQIDEQGIIHMTWWDKTPDKWIIYYANYDSFDHEQPYQTSNAEASVIILLFIGIALKRKLSKVTL